MAKTIVQEASARPKRVPIGRGNRLDIRNKDPNYTYRVVNDLDDRVDRFQLAGYEIVPSAEIGALGSKRVDDPSSLGSAAHFSVGKGTKAVVMRIPKEYALDDGKRKLQEIADSEQTMVSDQKRKADYGELT